MAISGRALDVSEPDGVFVHTVPRHLRMSMSKILRAWEMFRWGADFSGSSKRLDDDGRADLVDPLCRAPTSLTLRSYIRLGNLV